MPNRIVAINSITGLFEASTNNTNVVLHNVTLTSATPLTIPAGSQMIQHLNAEYIQGLTPADLRSQVLSDKKVLTFGKIENLAITTSTHSVNISDYLINNHIMVNTGLPTNSEEGVIIKDGSSYIKSFIVKSSNNGPILQGTDTIIGTISKITENPTINALWTNGSDSVTLSSTAPSNILGSYLLATNGNYYKVIAVTDPVQNIYQINSSYSGPTGSIQLEMVYFTLEFWKNSALTANSTDLDNITIDIYYPIRTNLQDINEAGYGIPDINYSSALENTGFVTQTEFDSLAGTPILYDSTQGTLGEFTSAIDINNLSSDLFIKSISGVGIHLGDVNDTVYIPNLQYTNLSDGTTTLTSTVVELNKLHGAGNSVTADNLNKLTSGGYITNSLNTHVIECVFGEGSLGDVVYIDNNNQTKKALADLSVSPDSIKALGILVKIDSTTAYVQMTGAVNVINYGFLNNVVVYLSPTTAGGITDTVPTATGTAVIKLGVVQSGNLILDKQIMWKN